MFVLQDLLTSECFAGSVNCQSDLGTTWYFILKKTPVKREKILFVCWVVKRVIKPSNLLQKKPFIIFGFRKHVRICIVPLCIFFFFLLRWPRPKFYINWIPQPIVVVSKRRIRGQMAHNNTDCIKNKIWHFELLSLRKCLSGPCTLFGFGLVFNILNL